MAKPEKHPEYQPSPDTAAKVAAYVASEKDFRDFMTIFEEQAPEWFNLIEAKRTARNMALDEAKRALREEAGTIDYDKLPLFATGPFKVEKARNRGYLTEKFLEIAELLEVDKALRDAKIITTSTEINRDEAMKWLKEHELTDKFADAYHEEDATPRIKGCDEVPPLGLPMKKG